MEEKRSFTQYHDQILVQAEDFTCLHLISSRAIDGMRFNSEAKREQFKLAIAELKRIRKTKRTAGEMNSGRLGLELGFRAASCGPDLRQRSVSRRGR